jgi:DNA repair protein RecN (Recombination protein N)
LAALARHHQVLVVTHLPQIAAYADRHFVVEKRSAAGETSTAVRTLDSGGRITELSRMLSGMEGSGLAQAHAEELLAAANAAKAGGPRAGGAPGAREGRLPGAAGAGGATGPRAAVGGDRS